MDRIDGKIASAKLNLGEHFILANIRHRLPHYLVLWAIAVATALVLSRAPYVQPVSDYEHLRSFCAAFMTIAVTTITFAIPSCMRLIFSAYEQYYSTKIKEILLDRFPVTLLALSAFTALMLSVMVISGLFGISFEIDCTFAFYLSLFWTLVCVAYLFVAIEKLIYFVVKAPYAVLDKLELGVSAMDKIGSKEDYAEFRRELASMNDIAATMLNRSTGQDEAVSKTLGVFRSIHAYYLLEEGAEQDRRIVKFHLNACRSVTHEMVRMFREACLGRNEHAARNILRTYCGMLQDAAERRSGISYFSEMTAQIPRMQSYANFSNVEEIGGLAFTNWFFILARLAGESSWERSYRTGVIRELAAGLRRATLERSGDGIMTKFFRIASNSEVEYDLAELSETWLAMLDRGVFLYMSWLIDAVPNDCEKYAGYIRKYSIVDSDIFRHVMCDTPERARRMLSYARTEETLEVAVTDVPPTETARIVQEKALSKDKTNMMLSLDVDDAEANAAALFVLIEYSGIAGEVPHSNFAELGRLADSMLTTEEGSRDAVMSCLLPDYEERLLEYAEAGGDDMARDGDGLNALGIRDTGEIGGAHG